MIRAAYAALLSSVVFVVVPAASAHDHSHHHHQEMKASAPALSGESLYNLDSDWLDSKGKKIKLSSLTGRPRIVAMLFTSCSTACPLIIQDMKSLQSKVPKAGRERLGMTVFSFDPERDTPEQLKKFAQKMKLDAKTWDLFSPTEASDATEMAAALGVQFKKLESGDYIHSNVVFLLDTKGEVIAKKEGLNVASQEFNDKVALAALAKK